LKILNEGEVTLIDSMGNDLAVVQAARISNGAAMPDWRGAPDEKLIRFLAEHQHMTPFEHEVFKFYVRAPIFVVREWQRHRTFSYNERSARYKKLEPEYFYPLMVRVPDPNNKQSSIVKDDKQLAALLKGAFDGAYAAAWTEYERMLEAGVAREVARSVLPLGIYTEMIVTGNFRNWMHWWELRVQADAQYEIQQYALAVGELIESVMPISFKALAVMSKS